MTDEKLAVASHQYYKAEYFASIACIGIFAFMALVTVFSVFLVQTNKFRLPQTYIIIWLPFDEIYSTNWILNYIFQFVTFLLGVSLFIIYSLLPFAVVNHSCFNLDELIAMTATLNQNPSATRTRLQTDAMNKFIARSQDIFEFHNESRSVLQFIFFLEFTVLSFLFCLSFYANIVAGSTLAFMLVPITLSHLFFLCFMGHRVEIRIEKLTFAIYDVEWYLKSLEQQKIINIMLVVIQNARNYHGIFNRVGMETFVAVVRSIYTDELFLLYQLQILQFGYSLLMLLRNRNASINS